MNVHPVLVHFPIALFTIYALFELVQWKKLTSSPSWFSIKAAMVIVGSLASVVTYLSGEQIESLFRGDPILEKLIEVHSSFALGSSLLFGLLALSYAIQVLARFLEGKPWMQSTIWRTLLKISRFILQPIVVVPLALIGLACITITGALGGAIVYGPNVDPAVNAIYNLFIEKT